MFYTLDGLPIHSDTAPEVVSELHNASRMRFMTNEKFMVAVSRWTKIYCDATVRYDTAENFVSDLIDAELIQYVM